MGRVSLHGFKCERCNHLWVPRDDTLPKVCPKCKSPYWDTPRGSRKSQSVKLNKLVKQHE